MFRSLFSDRYNNKRATFYQRYGAACLRSPNLPHYERAIEPRQIKPPRNSRKKHKFKSCDFDYDEWIQGDFISIVVRRGVEEKTAKQLMARQPSSSVDGCSRRTWPGAKPMGPRRSKRLTEQPKVKLESMEDRAKECDFEIKQELAADDPIEATPAEAFIAGDHPEWTPQCEMCGKYFSTQDCFEFHSLDACRQHLLSSMTACSI